MYPELSEQPTGIVFLRELRGLCEKKTATLFKKMP